MQIQEVEKDIGVIDKRIEVLNRQFDNTQKNMELQVEQNQESRNNFSDKIDLAKRFIENSEISQAIQVMKQISNEFEDELMLLNSRLHSYEQFFINGNITHHGLAHERRIIATELIAILKTIKNQ